jgi:hypothetical protein
MLQIIIDRLKFCHPWLWTLIRSFEGQERVNEGKTSLRIEGLKGQCSERICSSLFIVNL